MEDREAELLERLVRACARRGGDQPEDDPPILVLWSARSRQSAELLEGLRTLDDWPAPRVMIDGEAPPGNLRPYLLVNWLAFQLGQYVSRFGELSFPRLALGVWAAQNPLDPFEHPDARAARQGVINQLLARRADRVPLINDLATALGGVVPGMPPGADKILGLAAQGIYRAGRTQRLLRGPGLRWYRHGLGTEYPKPVGALVELSVQEFFGNHDRVDDVLYQAFLADLRTGFDARRSLYEHRTRALVLVNNAGAVQLQPLVSLLQRHPGGLGPLLVVAASHVRFPADAARNPASWVPDPLAAASRERWLTYRKRRGDSRLYPVWIDPVDDTPVVNAGPAAIEVKRTAERFDFLPADWQTVAFVHRLTAGHPAGLTMALRSLGAGPEAAPGRGPRPNPEDHDLRQIFDLAEERGRTLADLIFDTVLGPWPHEIGRGLVLMAVAADLSDARFASILGDASPEVRQMLVSFRNFDLWVTRPVADGQREIPRMHPFARRAIAQRLARPGGIEEVGLHWDAAHELLRDGALTDGDESAELYHRLALGEIQTVASRLSERFDPVDPRDWYRLLAEVTAAPLARPAEGRNTADRFGELSAHEEANPLVTRQLVAALTLHTDPLGDPCHDMCRVIETELAALAGAPARAGAPFLLEKSSVYQACWKSWHPGGGVQ